jgi:hypothetical protein
VANGGGVTYRPSAYPYICLHFGQLSVTKRAWEVVSHSAGPAGHHVKPLLPPRASAYYLLLADANLVHPRAVGTLIRQVATSSRHLAGSVSVCALALQLVLWLVCHVLY